MYRQGALDMGPYALSYFIRTAIFAVLFYVNYFYLIDKFLFKKEFVSFIAWNVLLIIILLGFQTVTLQALMPPHIPNIEFIDRPHSIKNVRPPYAMKMYTDYMLVFLVLGLSVALKTTMRWYSDTVKFEQAKNIQLEADLQNLRNQLNPHFLFNTLNNIYALIAIDSTKAQDSVHRLSNLLRYVLYENETKFVPLQKELEFTKNYIDLMALRLSSNVKLNVLIDDTDSSDKIASLMFITLIENAFKHGLNAGKESFIDVKILVEKGKGVLCTVENSISESETTIEKKNSGIGLDNLSKRLELIYPSKYEFTTERKENSFYALLRINFI